MAEFYLSSEAIECESALINTRKPSIGAILDIDKIGRCRKYSCDLNSSAQIVKELSPKPEKGNYNESSKLNLNDKLVCESLFLLVQGLKSLKFSVINLSGRHKAQEVTTKYFTYAEISKPFDHIVHAIENRKSLNS